jgi:hypothetical protein
MPGKDGALAFAYELQGYVASQVALGLPLDEACASVTELVDMLQRANTRLV